jgi:hypothetical protein
MKIEKKELEKVIWSAEGNPDLTKLQVEDIAEAIYNYLKEKGVK